MNQSKIFLAIALELLRMSLAWLDAAMFKADRLNDMDWARANHAYNRMLRAAQMIEKCCEHRH